MPEVQPQLNITTCFATPIIEVHLPQPQALNKELKALFLKSEEDENYRKKIETPTLQVKIFESEFDLFAWPQPCVRALRDFCMRSLYLSIAKVCHFELSRLNRFEILNHCWFHVTRFGGYISGHNHPMASWSGVYCVEPGEEVADYPDSGVLRFADPMPHAHTFLDPANMHIKPPFGGGSTNFKLKGGQLLLFPSYLMHEVAPFYGKDARITVAFNAWAKERSE